MLYIVACKSRFSGIQSVCKNENGEYIKFKTKEEAEDYARKRRDDMGSNYHYWVEEYN